MNTKKALLIRIDRLGDLILTLPADQQTALKDYDCHWYISKGLGFIANSAQPPRDFTEWDKKFSFKQCLAMYQDVRRLKPDVCVSFHSPWWVNMVLFLAGVPKRVGVLSAWHSYLFLNRGVRQKRSQCKHHEMEYNHLLVSQGLISNGTNDFPYLHLMSKEKKELELPSDFVVIHPGMAGSALNWPQTRYIELIQKIALTQKIVITGTKADQYILKELKTELFNNTNILWLDEKLSGSDLIYVLSQARAVFAPSTGVIHIAASLGVPTFGIYSPVPVQQAARWGPKGPQTFSFAPQVKCPAHFQCLGEQCPHFNCMELVAADEIYKNMQPYIQ